MRSVFGARRRLLSALRGRGWLVGLVVVVTTVGAAQAATATRHYHVTLDGSTAATTVGNTTTPHTLTLANSAGSTLNLGSANVKVPTAAGYDVTLPAPGDTIPATSSAGKQWTVKHAVTLSGSILEFRAATSQDALAPMSPEETVSAEIEVYASCDAGPGTWVSAGKQANDFSGPPGNGFTRDAPDPVLTVASAGATAERLEFTVQPPDRVKAGAVISPEVTITAYDACDNVATGATGNVAVAIGDDPSAGEAQLTETLSQPLDGDGVATFDDLSIDMSGEDYTLLAELEADTSIYDESDPFDVVDLVCTKLSESCFVQNGTTRVDAEVPTGDGTVALSLGSPKAQTSPCGGGGITPVGSWATIEPDTDAYTAALTTVKLTYSKEAAPGTGVANFIVCLGKPGTAGIAWTQLLDCGRNPKQTAPCIAKRNRTGAGDLVIDLLIKSEDPIGGTYS